MTSIEKSGSEDRFRANIPYKLIDIKFGDSNSKLEEIDWTLPSVLWLDYDSAISTSMLLDVEIAVSQMTSGSVLAITLNIEEAEEFRVAANQSEGDKVAVELFKSRFSDYSSSQIYSDNLRANPLRKLCHEIFSSKIEKSLATRNVGGEEGVNSTYESICQFNYADGHAMATFVFFLFDEQDRTKFHECRFEDLDFLSALGEIIKIQMPMMTLKEIREVESQLPTDNIATVITQGVPASDIRKFASIYRYLPNFAILEN